ncbi:influenza virus NS1A-binding protein-like [Nilaparvata lugens]|uniref:influenza virus NS1A-binding protein-like n=1 Tax=Nilaparvata lugens TaxID=108931 RepID=UPI00193E3563|nr:influenza virus NS1A-binding protein-like [Nilaparvata lugens]
MTMASSQSESDLSSDEMAEQTNAGLVFEDELLPPRTLHNMNMMRKNRSFCDVILKVGGTEIFAHKAVLAASCPHFLELFHAEDGLKGGTRETVVTYHLNGQFDKDALEIIINYAYTARLEVNANMVKTVYVTAQCLKMQQVMKKCANHLLQQLSVENCIEIRSLPGIARNIDLAAHVDSFIKNHFESVCKSSVLLNLPCVRVEVLNQTREEMSLVSPESLACLVLDWMKRSDDDLTIDALIDKTHLLYLALDNSLKDCSELPSNDVSNTEIVQDYKRQSKKNLQAHPPKSHRRKQVQPAKPRVLLYSRDISDSSIRLEENNTDWTVVASIKVAEHTFLALVMINRSLATLSILLRLNEVASATQQSPLQTPDTCQPNSEGGEPLDLYCGLTNMASVRSGAGCANLNDCLFVCGGYDKVECLRNVELYNPAENTWSELPAMKDARGRFNMAVVDGLAYAVGGCNGTTELATVECYSPERHTWTTVTPLPLARSNTGVCALDGKIYCIGGWNGQMGIRQCDRLVPDHKKWGGMAQLQKGRYQAGVCAFNGRVWAVGGCDGWNCLNSVEVYDPESDAWMFAAPMITARRGCGVAEFKGKLYAVGGSDGTYSLSTTEVYDPVEKIWSLGPNMTTPRSNAGVAVIGGRLYAVGGFSGRGFLNTVEYLDESTDEWTTFSLQRPVNGTDIRPAVESVLLYIYIYIYIYILPSL